MGVVPTLLSTSNSSSSGATFDHAFADVQKQIAIIQPQTQDMLTAQQHRVLSHPNLLTTVGAPVNSQLWPLDTAGAQDRLLLRAAGCPIPVRDRLDVLLLGSRTHDAPP